MNLPERQVRRIGEHVQELKIVLSTADLHDAVSSARKVVEIMTTIKEGDGIGGPAGGAGHENRAKLAFEMGFDSVLSREERSGNRGSAALEDLFVWNKDEVTRPLGIFRRIQQIELRGEGKPFEVFERTDRIGADAPLLEHLAIMLRERDDRTVQVMAQLLCLQLAQGPFR